MVDDPECIGGLDYEGVVERVSSRSSTAIAFEPQDHKFKVDDTPIDPATQKRRGHDRRHRRRLRRPQAGRQERRPAPARTDPGGPVRHRRRRSAALVRGRRSGSATTASTRPGPLPCGARPAAAARAAAGVGGASGPLVDVGERPLDAACRLVPHSTAAASRSRARRARARPTPARTWCSRCSPQGSGSASPRRATR